MKYFVFVVCSFFIILTCGCRSNKVTSATSRERNDSIHISETIRFMEKLFVYPKYSTNVNIPLRVIDGKVADVKPVKKKNRNSNITVSVKDGIIKGDCECDSIEEKFKVEVRDKTYYRLVSEKLKEQMIRNVPYTPKWKNYLAGIGASAIAIVIIYIAYKLGKLKFKIPL